MGISPFKNCSVNYSPTAVAPNPDPKYYSVKERLTFLNKYNEVGATLLTVNYLGCTNYEGVKILAYLGDFRPIGELDPHFQEGKKCPVARFEPTVRGKDLAEKFCRSLVE